MRPAQQAAGRAGGPQVTGSAWSSVGPSSIPNGQVFGFPTRRPVSGRVSAIAIDPGNANTIYLGGAQGGVWKSADDGASWMPLTDTQPSLAIGSIAIDPSNPNTIYAGTGEGKFALDSYFGAGVLKSTDGGASWNQLGASTFVGVSLQDLIIDPTNTQTIYVAAATGLAGVSADVSPNISPRGVYKSTNGGSTWTQLINGLPSTSAQDLAMDPTNSQVIYAAFRGVGIFRTTNGGAGWTQLTGGGFPSTGFQRIALDIAPASNLTIYAALEDSASSGGELLNIFKSVDGGTMWTQLPRPPLSQFSNICQCFYDNVIEVSPADPNTVFFGGVALYRSTNGGTTWTDLSLPGEMHADFHAIAFDPSNPNRIFVGNDGGVWSTTNSGSSWTNVNNNLSITQFQYIAAHPTDANTLYGGTQDNGTLKFTGTTTWTHSDFGDGGAVQIDPAVSTRIYHSRQNVSFLRSDNGGSSWVQRTSGLNTSDNALFYIPLAIDPSIPQTVYLGTVKVYKTTNGGDTWTALSGTLGSGNDPVSAIAVAPSSSSTLYAGTNSGDLFVTTDGGTSFTRLDNGLPQRYITRIAIDPANAQTAYLSMSGFQAGHVFKTTNGGTSWTNISGNLPDIPVNALVIDTSSANKLYVGTDIGVFVTTNGGTTWTEVATGLPNSAVFDLQINNTTNSLFAATHGRGVFKLQTGNADTIRAVTVVDATGAKGSSVTVPIQLVSQGDENALGFSLTFDTSILSNPQAVLGSGATGASLNFNTNQAAQGRIGIAIAMPAGQTFVAGTRQIVQLTFNVSASTSAASTIITFGDQPVVREVASASAAILTATYNPGTVTITDPIPALSISSFAPAGGCGGQAVVITGAGFVGVDTVKFNGVSATFTVNSDTQISASVPVGATSGPISVSKGAVTATSSSSFNVTSGPVITSFTPTSGKIGKKVTIVGTNLSGATAVAFGGVLAGISSNTATQIKAVVPSGAITGRITVTAGGCTAESSADFTAPATIASFDPVSGRIGDTITIRGVNFTGASLLLFKKVAANFTVVDSTTITAVVPAGAKTGILKLTTPAGTAKSSASFTVTP